MKTHRIITTLAALFGAAAFAAETKSSSSSSVTVNTTDGKGRAVITVDIDGKKETREIEIGNATKIEIRADESATRCVACHADADKLLHAVQQQRVPFLGVAMSPASDALVEQLGLTRTGGVVVGSVVPDSPAAKAGLQKHDVLVTLDGQKLKSPRALQEIVAARRAGDKVEVCYLRHAQPGTTEIVLGPGERRITSLGELGDSICPMASMIGKDLGIHRKAIVVGPDGKVIERDPAAQMRDAVENVERALRESKVGEKTVEAVQDALRQAVEALERARQSGDGAVKQAQRAVAEAQEHGRRAGEEVQRQAEQIRRQVEKEVREQMERVRRDAEEQIRRAHEEAARKAQPQPPLEKPQ